MNAGFLLFLSSQPLDYLLCLGPKALNSFHVLQNSSYVLVMRPYHAAFDKGKDQLPVCSEVFLWVEARQLIVICSQSINDL